MISAALRLVGEVVSPGGIGGCLTILTYHRVLAERDPLLSFQQIDAACFERQMATIKSHFKVLPLDEALEMMRQGKLPSRALSITFDDGYLDNHTVAWPILRRHGLSATFFVCTGYLGNGLMFNDVLTEGLRATQSPQLDLSWLGLGLCATADHDQKRAVNTALVKAVKYLPAQERAMACDRFWDQAIGVERKPTLMMAHEHVKDLAHAGMVIGGHTHTHPILTRIALEEARQDMALNRAALKDITGKHPTLFAYPNGRPSTDFTSEHAQLVEDLGYSAAVTTACGVARASQNPFQLPRFAPWDHQSTRFVLHLLKNAWTGRDPTQA